MRFISRFSLRFALLALTVFLIVFGVGVKYWRDYQQHSATIERLLNAGWAVEEEQVSLWGYTIGMKLTGLQLNTGFREQTVAAFLEIPSLRDLRRFGVDDYHGHFQPLAACFDKLVEAEDLERFHFTGESLTDEHLQRIGNFTKLRILYLSRHEFSAENQKLFDLLPKLEIFELRGDCSLEEFLQHDLPNLKFVKMYGDFSPELKLTRAAWGRYPRLETLDFEGVITKVSCESGALPRLRHLVLTRQCKNCIYLRRDDCDIDWQQFPASVPNLEALSLDASQVNGQMLEQLRQLKQLRLLHLEEDNLVIPERTAIENHGNTLNIPTSFATELSQFLERCPQVELERGEGAFLKRIYPREFQVQDNNDRLWDSEHWHPRSPKSTHVY